MHGAESALRILLSLMLTVELVRQPRAAGSTMAWIILSIFLPYLALPLYIFFGQRKIKVPRELATKNSTQKVPPLWLRILSGQRSTDPAIPESQHRRIELIVSGEHAYAQYLELISQAKKSIFVSTFILSNDPVGRSILNALTTKASHNVDVRLIVDSLGATILSLPPLFRFKRAGGKMIYFLPFFQWPLRGHSHLRNHRKLLVTDGDRAIVGGMNLAREYMGPKSKYKTWVDLALRIEGPLANDLTQMFLKDWHFAHRTKEITDNLLLTPPEEDAKSHNQVLPSGPDVKADSIYDLLLTAIFSAKEEIRICTPYFIPDETLTKALELASRRGVRVEVLIPKTSNHWLADIARASFVRQLTRAGVQFYFYPQMLHAKVFQTDRQFALVGSANFDMRSLLLNYEVGIFVSDPPTNQAIDEWLRFHFQRAAGPTPTDPQRSNLGLWREALEGFGRVLGPFM